MKAYAKINLSLDITGKRADGYHELCSVMQQISLADEVYLSPGQQGITMACDQPSVPVDARNIIIKAAKAFFRYVGMDEKDIHFTLVKKVPSGAGLGGGSSDGVAAVRLLDEHFETSLSDREMASLVAPIGADMPFFVYGHTALCEGIGERVTPLAASGRYACVLLKPAQSLSTPAMYAAFDRETKQARRDTPKVLSALRAKAVTPLAAALGNALEPIGQKQCPYLSVLKEKLLSVGAAGACMSGSGSTVYGLFADEKAAAAAAERLEKEHLPQTAVYVCKFI